MNGGDAGSLPGLARPFRSRQSVQRAVATLRTHSSGRCAPPIRRRPGIITGHTVGGAGACRRHAARAQVTQVPPRFVRAPDVPTRRGGPPTRCGTRCRMSGLLGASWAAGCTPCGNLPLTGAAPAACQTRRGHSGAGRASKGPWPPYKLIAVVAVRHQYGAGAALACGGLQRRRHIAWSLAAARLT